MPRPRSHAATLLDGVIVILATAAVVLLATGCGGSTKASSVHAPGPPAARRVADQLMSQDCSASSMSTPGSPEVRYCVFILPDGQRFKCNMASFEASAPTVGEVEASKSCVRLRRVSVPTASAHVVRAIAKARACLASHRFYVRGGAVPPEGHGPGGPEGELIAGGPKGELKPGAALIAFYADARIAERAEPEVLRNVRDFEGKVDRHGAVTILWLQSPTNRVRADLQACAFT
jgi:hypothetical protein